ncbi:hypothetical protein BDR03DRAFT_976516 [Suillus americanus]|nr:hypothetical protein BDR03DRAFT_976516 [Suillus americanus]
MVVAPSASPKKLERRDHAQSESETWPWHRQRPLRSSKDEPTHCLRERDMAVAPAGHGRGTVSVR